MQLCLFPIVFSLAAAQQLLTAASLGQSSGGRSLIYPNILPVSQSSLIPVVDSNGVTQLMAAASPASTHSSQPTPQTVPPIVFLGPGGIPLLPAAAAATQPAGMYLVNPPATDLQRSPSATSVTLPSLSAVATSQPSYIVFPQSFQMPQTLSLEQLQSLSASIQHQRQEQLQQVRHGRGGQTPPPTRQTGSNSDVVNPPTVKPIHVNNHHNINGDEVEEHFARALGEKWHQFKKDGSPPNKIST